MEGFTQVSLVIATKSEKLRAFIAPKMTDGEYAMNYIEIFQNAQALSVSVGKNYS